MTKSYILKSLTAIIFAATVVTASAQDSARAKPKVPAATPRSAASQPAGATANRPATPVNPYAGRPVTPSPVAPNDKSLNGQYQYLLTKIYGYQRPQLSAFYKNITDTIRMQRQKLQDVQRKLTAQGKAVQDLQSDVSAKEQSLNESNSKADAISFLGIPVTKSTYNLIMWGLVLVFGIVTAIVLFQSTSARREARYRTKLYDELDEEYKTYKVKANEKEKKLARELQTERNKLDELLGRS
ncbi:hypothetical protein [Mucilaginibacter lacusdianchii]|uniref:hypothetical protein n=1 Tax=Mucilaginibacter lacusdianchii TaxID=2684211 RepID=UPI00131BEA9B|nr:hypothetical protein [Mucilaginibacter sp. JXJ CY 39]